MQQLPGYASPVRAGRSPKRALSALQPQLRLRLSRQSLRWVSVRVKSVRGWRRWSHRHLAGPFSLRGVGLRLALRQDGKVVMVMGRRSDGISDSFQRMIRRSGVRP